jgi:hypothetical protein
MDASLPASVVTAADGAAFGAMSVTLRAALIAVDLPLSSTRRTTFHSDRSVNSGGGKSNSWRHRGNRGCVCL